MLDNAAFLEKIKTIGGIIRGGTPRFHANKSDDLYALCRDKESPIAQMVKDKTMFRHIREGNINDSILKCEAQELQTRYSYEQKEKKRTPKLKRIQDLKTRFKARYGVEADLLATVVKSSNKK